VGGGGGAGRWLRAAVVRGAVGGCEEVVGGRWGDDAEFFVPAGG
jgi:hypothetical protein